MLAVSPRSVQSWTKDARKYEREQQQAAAWDAWLDCRAQTEIAETIGVDQKTISNWLGERANLREFLDPPASRQHFDIWSFPTADGESSYFGRMPPQVVENLLWLYTEPGQIVFDPFAGGGTTIDVAKRMGVGETTIKEWVGNRKVAETDPPPRHDLQLAYRKTQVCGIWYSPRVPPALRHLAVPYR